VTAPNTSEGRNVFSRHPSGFSVQGLQILRHVMARGEHSIKAQPCMRGMLAGTLFGKPEERLRNCRRLFHENKLILENMLPTFKGHISRVKGTSSKIYAGNNENNVDWEDSLNFSLVTWEPR